MITQDFRTVLAGVMREQGLTTPEAAALCRVPLPVFVQLLQGPTTTDLASAERILGRLGVGLRLSRVPAEPVRHTLFGETTTEET